jgi:DNA/RNA-binding domain of Phe-tRNA-synthetase-like protein
MDRLDVVHELPGWELAWYRLEVQPGAAEASATARERGATAARERFRAASPVDLQQAAEVRRLFRQAGTDPTRYRPSSEALLRRVLRGDPLPAIHPLVDLNNCLSISLVVPSCVMPEGSFSPPLRLRRGAAGERFSTLRGDFELAGKPLLADRDGPFGTPISDSLRVAVLPETKRAWIVVYLPAGVVGARDVEAELDAVAPIARRSDGFVSGP